MAIHSNFEISVIIPFYNEEDNIESLLEEVITALDPLKKNYEVLCVNDGSQDNTGRILEELCHQKKQLKVINLARNFGQTAAMMAGFDTAKGDILIALDGDGQNDPAEIPRIIFELEKGFDVVSGWRKNRQDKAIKRRLPSVIANKMISLVSGVHLHDYGCSLKGYRREVFSGVRLYGEMHRFIPIYTKWHGGSITEIPVNHRARRYGESKYGLNRTLKVMLDLLFVSFMGRYLTKPMYIFGGVGIFLLFLSLASGLWAIKLKVLDAVSFIETPLPLLTGTFFTSGLLCFLMGLLAEIVTRIYYESQDKKTYRIKNKFDGQGIE